MIENNSTQPNSAMPPSIFVIKKYDLLKLREKSRGKCTFAPNVSRELKIHHSKTSPAEIFFPLTCVGNDEVLENII